MAPAKHGLGGRLPLIDPATLTGDRKNLYDTMRSTLITWADRNGFRGMTDDGELIGPFNPYLYSTGITPGFLAWMDADAKHTTLDEQTHEVVILTVGAIWRSPYEMYAHSAVARAVGLADEVIDGLCRGETPPGLTDGQLLAHRFARQLTREHRVDDDLYREAERHFGSATLVDIVYLVGLYLLTCALLNAFQIPKPDD
ncbi:carboxymuconolactone decarboxylase family protein [Mycolicibacterium sp. 018/SC-01/001]|uniref:carboxymuconolactone decarboxylase family protein n=1 Tax=Mycolicibacterium sp. 018/SC-01/001 TaxID=2592069 RepID=UPI00117DCCF7|nr:carboxymuconolactone decarboxylase family protein [Mycolicibacterium sp. 018/SC-01/001]TRW80746.1 carboxymuconolactone decarboxylase family protein [Mycolicibacterium sp. 018/SC-01/001]